MRKAILHLKKADPVLANIIERVGPYRVDFREATFESLARSIVYQQLSGKAAATIFGRLVHAVGGKVTPANVLKLSPEELRSFGFSKQKASYVMDLAERVHRAEVVFEDLHILPDDEVIATLTQVKGVGVWTVHMFLMFAMQRPNVLPVGDLGIQKAVQKAYKMRKAAKPADVERVASKWHPYCSVAAWYLWR